MTSEKFNSIMKEAQKHELFICEAQLSSNRDGIMVASLQVLFQDVEKYKTVMKIMKESGLEPEQFFYEAAMDWKRIDKECA